MSFIDTMHRNLDAAAQRALMIEVRGDRLDEVSGAKLKQWVAAARGYLAAHGVGAGERLALSAHNSARWAAADLAGLGAGCIVVPMYDRQAPNELAGMLQNCGAKLVVVDTPKLKGEIEAAWQGHSPVVTLDELFAHAPAQVAPVARSARDAVTMIYTSGTSGEPKGVLYTVENVDFMLERTTVRLKEMVGDRAGDDRVFHYLPFCFAGSRIQLWSQLARANALMVSTDLNNLVQELGTAQPHYFLNVPTLLERIKLGVGNKLKERGGLVYALYRAALDAADRAEKG
ncbi:MAG TPA: AMP-binding protein, partial [Polyangiales bacterium]